MRLRTKLFGDIQIDDAKIILFENGIIGFPDLKRFTLIYDEENADGAINWLQCIDEPTFALPVLNPRFINSGYDPYINDELLKPLGELTEDNICILVTITVPQDIKKLSVNLKAPIVINIEEKKGTQLIVEDEFPVKFEIYNILEAQKEEAGGK
mgnify:FL=1